jgi:hypothetical protein
MKTMGFYALRTREERLTRKAAVIDVEATSTMIAAFENVFGFIPVSTVEEAANWLH